MNEWMKQVYDEKLDVGRRLSAAAKIQLKIKDLQELEIPLKKR
jgi:hypothetical protein